MGSSTITIGFRNRTWRQRMWKLRTAQIHIHATNKHNRNRHGDMLHGYECICVCVCVSKSMCVSVCGYGDGYWNFLMQTWSLWALACVSHTCVCVWTIWNECISNLNWHTSNALYTLLRFSSTRHKCTHRTLGVGDEFNGIHRLFRLLRRWNRYWFRQKVCTPRMIYAIDLSLEQLELDASQDRIVCTCAAGDSQANSNSFPIPNEIVKYWSIFGGQSNWNIW